MTGTRDKLRGVFLAALMVFSVFAGTIALTGAAAAEVPDVDQEPVEFTVDGSSHIEVVFEDDASGLEYELEDVNGDPVNATVNTGLSDLANGRVVLDIERDLNGEPTLTVTDPADSDDEELDVTTTATLIQDPGDTSGDVGVDDEAEVFKGERFAVTPDLSDPGNVSTSEAFDISEGGEFPFLSRTTGANSFVSVIDTGTISELQAGEEYYLTYEDSGANVSVGVRNLGLSAEAEDRTLTFKSGETAEIEATASSNVAGRQVEFRLLRNGNYDDNNVTATIDGDGEVTEAFEVDRRGNYTVEVADLQTDISDTTEAIRVSQVSGDVSFAQSVVSEDRGDVAMITVEMQNRDTATVNIGGDDVSYLSSVDIEDGDDDGQVTLLFNTFAPSSAGVTFDVMDDDDSIEDVEFNQSVSNPLAAASYEMNVTDGGIRGAEQAVGTLSLTERSTESLNIWTAEENALNDLDEPGPISTYAAAGNLSQDSTIAEGDLVVHQLQASGIFGALNATDDSNYTNALYELDVNGGGAGATNLSVYEAESTVAPNADGMFANISDLPLGDVETVADPENNTLYVMFSSDALLDAPNAEVDDRFVTNFTLREESDLTGNEDESVTAEYRIVDRELEFDTTGEVGGEDVIEVQAASNQSVSGTTSVAAGTEVSVSARSTGDSPFLLSQDAVVQPDGTFNATFDFTNVSAGQNFTVDASGNWEDDPETDGVVVEAATATPTATPEPTVTGTATAEPTPTATPGEETPTETPSEETPTDEPATPSPETTEGDGAGFGIVVALIALIGAALLAVRRNE